MLLSFQKITAELIVPYGNNNSITIDIKRYYIHRYVILLTYKVLWHGHMFMSNKVLRFTFNHWYLCLVEPTAYRKKNIHRDISIFQSRVRLSLYFLTLLIAIFLPWPAFLDQRLHIPWNELVDSIKINALVWISYLIFLIIVLKKYHVVCTDSTKCGRT